MSEALRRRQKLVFHVPSLAGGGAEKVMVLIAGEMARRGHDTVLFVWNQQGPNAELVDSKVRLVSLDLPIRDGGFGKAQTLWALARTARFFGKEKPDTLFSALEFANLLMAITLKSCLNRASFIPTYHAAADLESKGIAYRVMPFLDRVTIARAKRAVGVSNGVSADLFRRGFRPEQVVTINNPIPPNRVSLRQDHPWKDELAAMGDGPVLACLGRLVPVKDHRTLLDAFSRVQAVRRCRLVIFGDGPLEPDLRRQASSLGIADTVLFAGYVNDPAACYAVSDLVVSSSTTEGFGNVLVEAMAAGVRVVSTDAPHGPREILAGGIFGSLVPVGDADALATAILQTLQMSFDPQKLKARAADFALEAIGDRYEALLSNA